MTGCRRHDVQQPRSHGPQPVWGPDHEGPRMKETGAAELDEAEFDVAFARLQLPKLV